MTNSQKALPVIKSLWIGDRLGRIEKLAYKSFVANGHTMELFVYDDVKNVPKGVVLRDANLILPREDIFEYKDKKSVVGFSDWFRYKMIYNEGGVWVDADMICLRPFSFANEVVFGRQEDGVVNNAVVGAPPGHSLFGFMAKQAASPNDFLPFDSFRVKRRKLKRRFLQGNKRGNVKWGEAGPLGLSQAVEHFNLGILALPVRAFYPIHPAHWEQVFDSTFFDVERFFPDSYGIHLWNEMMRRKPGFNKEGDFPKDSLIELLAEKYDL